MISEVHVVRKFAVGIGACQLSLAREKTMMSVDAFGIIAAGAMTTRRGAAEPLQYFQFRFCGLVFVTPTTRTVGAVTSKVVVRAHRDRLDTINIFMVHMDFAVETLTESVSFDDVLEAIHGFEGG